MEGAEDEDGKAQRTRRKRQLRTKTGRQLRMEAGRREGSRGRRQEGSRGRRQEGSRGRGGNGVRWVDKEMRGLGMWKAAEDGGGKAGRCRGWRRESARDKAEKGPALFQAGPFYNI